MGESIFQGHIICRIAYHATCQTTLNLCLTKKIYNRWINDARILHRKVILLRDKTWETDLNNDTKSVQNVRFYQNLVNASFFELIPRERLLHSLFPNLIYLDLLVKDNIDLDDFPNSVRSLTISVCRDNAEIRNITSQKHFQLKYLDFRGLGTVISEGSTLDFTNHVNLKYFTFLVRRAPGVSQILVPRCLKELAISILKEEDTKKFIFTNIPNTLHKLGLSHHSPSYFDTNYLDISSFLLLDCLTTMTNICGIIFPEEGKLITKCSVNKKHITYQFKVETKEKSVNNKKIKSNV